MTRDKEPAMFRFFHRRPARHRARARRFCTPRCEQLEDRRVLSTETWTGGDNDDSNWTSNGNWAGIGGARQLDDLVFPAGAVRLTNTNDFVANTFFNSISITGNGYTINGNQLTLREGVTSSASNATFNPDLHFFGNQTFSNSGTNLIFGGGINTGGDTLTIDGTGNTIFNGLLEGVGAIEKDGAGTAVINGSSLLPLNLNAGALQVDGAASGALTLRGGSLEGTGTVGVIHGNFATNAGTIAPGDGPAATAVLASNRVNSTIAGIALGSAITLAIDLNGTTAGTQYDRLLDTADDIDLGGCHLSISLGFTPAVGQQFTIVQATGAGNTIVNRFAQGGNIVADGQMFSISYNPTSVVLTALDSTLIWDGGGTDNNWSTAANWNPDVVPFDGLDLGFPPVGPGNRLSNTNDLSGLNVRSITVSGGEYLIDGNALMLSSGITVTAPSGAGIDFKPNIALTGAQTFSNTGPVASFNGQLNLNGFALTIDGTRTSSFAGQITGSGGIVKNGTGTLILEGTGNNYTGITQINNGVVRVLDTNSLGATGAGNHTVVASGATLELDFNSLNVPEAITLTGTGVGGAGALQTRGCDTGCSISAAITLAGNSTVNAGESQHLILGGAIGGAFDLTKIGDGTLLLSGTSPLTGNVEVSAGGLSLMGSLTAASSVNVLADAVLRGTGTIHGATNIGGHLAPGANIGVLTTGNLTLSAGSTFEVRIAGGSSDQENVTGSVTIDTAASGVALNLIKAGAPTFHDGQQFTIIKNDGADAVQGTFKGLPDGFRLGSNFLGSSFNAKITYHGGDGNDVAIEISSHSPFPWHNDARGLDVTDDGDVVAADVIAVINYINAFGTGPIPANSAVGQPFGFLDTSKDNSIDPIDALNIINFINAGGAGGGPAGEGEGIDNESGDDLLVLLAADSAEQATH